MVCINCHKPMTGGKLVLGIFMLCDGCVAAGERNKRLLEQGISVTSIDPKTGNTYTKVYKDSK